VRTGGRTGAAGFMGEAGGGVDTGEAGATTGFGEKWQLGVLGVWAGPI